jgi:hypothetical protein
MSPAGFAGGFGGTLCMRATWSPATFFGEPPDVMSPAGFAGGPPAVIVGGYGGML